MNMAEGVRFMRRSDGSRWRNWGRFLARLNNEKFLHLLLVPTIVYFIIFAYIPMYGIVVAFQDYSPLGGFTRSPWVGLQHFRDFFGSPYFPRLIRNTVLMNLYSLVWGFPMPILFALLLNECKNSRFKKVVQTVSYFPNFVSVVIIVGLMNIFLSPMTGLLNVLLVKLGHDPIYFMGESGWFRSLYVGSGIWQGFGWGSIIYLAALAGVPQELYEAAAIDGANRFQQAIHVSLPSILPTIVLLLILNIGGLLSLGADKIILMYQARTYEVADVISSYVYRRGLMGGEFSFGAAVGLFNNVVNFVLLIAANRVARKVTEFSLW
jgi:putative aldouronate transport system permease protein